MLLSTIHLVHHILAIHKITAIQEIPPKVNLSYSLRQYKYLLQGKGGNDLFYLGPQYAVVEGDEGSDTYYVTSKEVKVAMLMI